MVKIGCEGGFSPLLTSDVIFFICKYIMFWNPYSQLFSLSSGNRALFNYVNDSAIILTPKLYEIIEPLIIGGEFSEIEQQHPRLYQSLRGKEFIIDQHDSASWVLGLLEKKLCSSKIFRLTINPTLDCNLRCWYCYQTHTRNCYMSADTKDAVLNLAKKKIADNQLEAFHLSFFGGEPLLRASKIALPLAREIANLCQIYDKRLRLHFTTNGILLSRRMLEQIKEICSEVSFQIPFDGGRDFHNQTKRDQRGLGGYDITLRNIEVAVALGLQVNVRCNYTLENIDSFAELITDIRSRTLGKEHYINFSLQRVWQENPTEELACRSEEIASLIDAKSNKYSESSKRIPPTFCYADYENSIVVNYDGALYKCTARDFTLENRVGTLLPNGDMELRTDKYSFGKRYQQVCQDCSILPICTICTQARCEVSDSNLCPVTMSDEDKKRQISNRFFTIYGQSI